MTVTTSTPVKTTVDGRRVHQASIVAHTRQWTAAEARDRQAELGAFTRAHSLPTGTVTIDGNRLEIEIPADLDAEQTVSFQRWLDHVHPWFIGLPKPINEADLFTRCGHALCSDGPKWKEQFGHLLGIKTNSVDNMSKGTSRVPPGVWERIHGLASARIGPLEGAIAALRSLRDDNDQR